VGIKIAIRTFFNTPRNMNVEAEWWQGTDKVN
jgi:hypothetical protein